MQVNEGHHLKWVTLDLNWNSTNGKRVMVMGLIPNDNFWEFLNGEKYLYHRFCHLTNGWYTIEIIISNLDSLFHQTLTEHITFQISLQNNYTKNYVIFEGQLTLINDFRASCNSLFISLFNGKNFVQHFKFFNQHFLLY